MTSSLVLLSLVCLQNTKDAKTDKLILGCLWPTFFTFVFFRPDSDVVIVEH